MDNVFVANHSRVESSIIGKRANVSRYCRIGEPDSFRGSKGVTVVEEDALLAPYMVVNQEGPTMPAREGIEMQVAAAF
jgi:acyl-[acyl carrier protein]--UDP-N-acetylglucosamine O-acyltransferase